MKTKSISKLRQSNIELLRIISMLLIISFHYVYKSGYVFEYLNLNSFIVKVFYLFGELGVNLFFLITGYFMVDSKFSVKKLIKLLLEVEFYHLLSMMIAIKLGVYTFTRTKEYFLLFFPTTLNKYWFVTVYILLYIFSPYLNILIKNLTKSEYKKLLIILLVIWSILPTFFGLFYNTTENLLYYSRFIWAIVIYFTGAYIKQYPIKYFSKISKSILSATVSFILMIVAIFVIYYFKDIFSKVGTSEVAYFWPPNSVLMYILSISIYNIFLKIKIKSSKVINRLASTTLGVYLIHDGILLNYIWHDVFHTLEHLQGKYSIFYILISAIIIFLGLSIVDLIRQTIENILTKKVRNFKNRGDLCGLC